MFPILIEKHSLFKCLAAIEDCVTVLLGAPLSCISERERQFYQQFDERDRKSPILQFMEQIDRLSALDEATYKASIFTSRGCREGRQFNFGGKVEETKQESKEGNMPDVA